MKKISAFLCIILIFVFPIDAFAYIPRLDAPEKNNVYYTSLNPYYHSGFGMTEENTGNCTCYAYGRSYENLGRRPSLSLSDAYKWYGHNISGGYYPYSSDITMPSLGAVAVWQKRGTSWGHVAVVEKIDGDTVTTSESGWEQYYFKTMERNMSDPSLGQEDYDFLGYIYVCGAPSIAEAPKAVRNLSSAKTEYTLGEKADFKWNVSYGTGAYWVYIWYDGTEIYGESVGRATDFSFIPEKPGEYKIIVNAVNSYGFSGSEYAFSVKEEGRAWSDDENIRNKLFELRLPNK